MKRYSIILIMTTLLLGACEKSEFQSEGDFFHVVNKGAKLPIWVKGNFNSDVMIITVHGGPGDSGMEQHMAKGFKMLEEDYLIVYWDQRNSGMSQGRDEVKQMHPDHFIDDTDKVVRLVQDKYPGKNLFMIGHSWGGQLSAGYLGRDGHYENFKGWIDLNGSIYGELESQLMKEYILERVPAKMKEPDANLEFWQVILDFYKENPAPGNYSSFEPYWYVSALGGDVYDYEKFQEEVKIPYMELIFKSMFAMSFYVDAFYSEEVYGSWDDINYTPELQNITIPALMLWGADDGIVPAGVADYVYEHLGTDPSMKEVVKIPECGHGPQHEQPEIFFGEVSSFVETYKNQ